MHQKTILLTGASGQLGSEIKAIAPEFLDYLWIFTDIDELNITQKKETKDFIDKLRPDVIINCAAYTAVDKAENDRQAAYALNTEAVENLAIICKEFNILLVHISTDYVFDGKAFQPYHENHPRKPNGYYAQTKAMAEEAIEKHCRFYLTVRTSWLYSQFCHNFLKTILRLGAEKNIIRIVSDQTGTPTYAAHLAQAIIKMIDKTLLKPELSGAYHVSNEGICSWYDFATEILDAAGLDCHAEPIETHEYPLPAPRPFYSVMSKQRIRNTFDIQMPHWRKAMLECLQKINEADKEK